LKSAQDTETTTINSFLILTAKKFYKSVPFIFVVHS